MAKTSNNASLKPQAEGLFTITAALALCLFLALVSVPGIIPTLGQLDSPESSLLSKESAKSVFRKADTGIKLKDVPKYSGEAAVAVNRNKPAFTKKDLKQKRGFELYGPQDSLGRCTQAFAIVGTETIPTEERGAIGMVKPSGWHTIRYSFVDGQYLYNRCHLIGYQLTAENANENNLVTGTRSLNIVGMLPYENEVANYVERTGNHVAYRVTPWFKGDELVCRGIQIEAQSLEDSGKGVHFNVYCYNVEPGVKIDYATGESELSAKGKQLEATNSSEASGTTRSSASSNSTGTYVVNLNSKKFHLPNCPSVSDMAEKNKKTYKGKASSLTNNGYSPCKNCNPQ